MFAMALVELITMTPNSDGELSTNNTGISNGDFTISFPRGILVTAPMFGQDAMPYVVFRMVGGMPLDVTG